MAPSTSMTWKERMGQAESEQLQKLETNTMVLHAGNKKDDTTPRLIRTRWPELFAGKNIKLVGATRFLNPENTLVMKLSSVTQSQLKVLGGVFSMCNNVSLGVSRIHSMDRLLLVTKPVTIRIRKTTYQMITRVRFRTSIHQLLGSKEAISSTEFGKREWKNEGMNLESWNEDASGACRTYLR